MNALEDPESLKQKDRVFFVSGRAGQGKSTVLRKLFLAILGSGRKNRRRPNFLVKWITNSLPSSIPFRIQHFAQGRAAVDVSLVNAEGNRRLIFIDGLDESTRQIQFISAMISKNPNSVLLFHRAQNTMIWREMKSSIWVFFNKRLRMPEQTVQSQQKSLISVSSLTLRRITCLTS